MLTEIQRFTSDVITAAGLLYHGKKDKALASRIDTGAVDLRMWIQQYGDARAAAAAAQARMKALSELERIVYEPPLDGNTIAQAQVLMAIEKLKGGE